MNRVKSVCVHDDNNGRWKLDNSLNYTDEELDIIIKSATAAKEYNKRYYERLTAQKKAKAEKRKNRVGIKEKIFNSLFCCEED